MNIKARVLKLEHDQFNKADNDEVRAVLRDILVCAKNTPPFNLPTGSLYCLPPGRSIASDVFVEIFNRFGVPIE